MDGDTFTEDVFQNNFIAIPEKIILNGYDTYLWFEKLREKALNATTDRFTTKSNFDDEELKILTSLNKHDFRILFEHCQPVEVYGSNRPILKKHFIAFLMKLRKGLSDEFIKVVLKFPSRQYVSLVVKSVRKSIIENFCVNHIGVQQIARDDLIAQHVTDFANILYNHIPEQRKAILYPDCTYLEIPHSSNFQFQRQTYSMHKRYSLVKVGLVVAPDGYILNVHGPYCSDVQNNDASILIDDMTRDRQNLSNWVRDGDIFVVDRGYRDALQFLDDLNLNHEMPPTLRNRQRQFTTEEANQARKVTSTRWIVESRNGHLKSIFEFFAGRISLNHVEHLDDFVKIACAIINRFHPTIQRYDANAEQAQRMLQLAQEPNILQQRVEDEQLNHRFGQGPWVPIEDTDLEDFPRLSIPYLCDKTIGTYQVSLAPAYIQDRMNRQNANNFILEVQAFELGLIRSRLFSRFSQATRHTIYIQYNAGGLGEAGEGPLPDPIRATYCNCKSGARTLGVCVHVASILWYLGFGRFNEINAQYPSTRLLEIVHDTQNRRPNLN